MVWTRLRRWRCSVRKLTHRLQKSWSGIVKWPQYETCCMQNNKHYIFNIFKICMYYIFVCVIPLDSFVASVLLCNYRVQWYKRFKLLSMPSWQIFCCWKNDKKKVDFAFGNISLNQGLDIMLFYKWKVGWYFYRISSLLVLLF